MGKKVILNFDESGNMGRKGRYFTIACVEMESSTKPLTNVMKRAVLKTKKTFSEYQNVNEVKASDSTPIIKDYILQKIASKDIKIRYIVADLLHVKQELKDDENLLYNYLLQFVILGVVKGQSESLSELEINLDKRTIKVKSTNSFAEYIKTKLNYEMDLGLKISVNYIESQNSYAIQAADFVANAISTKYEYQYCYYYDLLTEKIEQSEKFPRVNFGREKII
ncbi:DUF3800 domain-containing protein [Bacillus thuringiensis]|uniref:DUF3800 domain-containing protein n=1 Tax=Bacillus TaxID=1386 RepID=UPI001911DBEA|nr:DUF3800 domain-containing protein [Bacillus sp. TH13]MBK5495301.1 DUF3800 domain-containing protein [Bacillus sp. TH13]